MKLEPYLTPYTKINSKCNEVLNIRPETIKSLEKHIEKMLHNTDKDSLNMTPKTQATKANISKLNYIKLKISLQQMKQSIEEWNRPHTGRKYLQAMILRKVL